MKLTRVLESLKPTTLRADEIEGSTKRIDLPNGSLEEEDFGGRHPPDQDGISSDLVKAEMPQKPQKQRENSAKKEIPEKLQIIEVFNPSPGRSTWFTSTPSGIGNKNRPVEGWNLFLNFKSYR